MKIIIGNVYSALSFENVAEYEYANEILKVYVPGHQYVKAFKNKFWDGKRSLLHSKDTSTGLVLTGLLPLVKLKFTKAGMSYSEIENEEKTLRVIDFQPGKMPFELYEYQSDAINKIILKKRGIIEFATNAGKTEVFAGFCNNVLKQNEGNILLVCYGVSLVDQTFERLNTYFPGKVGIIQSNRVDLKQITIASINTLFNKRGTYKVSNIKYGNIDNLQKHYEVKKQFDSYLVSVKYLFFDECHLSSSDTWTLVSIRCINAGTRIGLSATPFGENVLKDMLTIGHMGFTIAKIKAKELIEKGISARCDIFMKEFKHEEHYFSNEDAKNDGIINNSKRNSDIAKDVYAEKEKNPSARILIMTLYIEHAHILKDSIEFLLNRPVAYIDGSVKGAKKRLSLLQNDIVISTTVTDVGLDLDIDVLVLAGGGKSARRTIQRLGRVQRRKRKKEFARIIDRFDKDDNGYLERHSRKRYNTYKSEGHKIERIK